MADNRSAKYGHLSFIIIFYANNIRFRHYSTSEYVYQGYRIPKGSVMTLNTWLKPPITKIVAGSDVL